MSISEALLALVLFVAASLIAYGAWLVYAPAGFMVGGTLLAGWALLALHEAEPEAAG